MDYDLRNFLTTTREKITPALVAYLRAKTAESNANTELLKERLLEQEWRNRHHQTYRS